MEILFLFIEMFHFVYKIDDKLNISVFFSIREIKILRYSI